MKLSVVIASYNTGKFVEPTLDSIFEQDFSDFECIVIDGASTDDTLEKLKKYPGVKIISEKDRGSFDAFSKGIQMARGEYITQCCFSDGYLDMSWFRKCVEAMDADKEVSLVWGLPQFMKENGELLAVSFPQFHKKLPPQKEEFFYYWLASYFWFPEGNFCVRANVIKKCFPEFNPENMKNIEPWLEFNFNFQKGGYLPLFLPTVASYGRIHAGQLGEREAFSGTMEKKSQRYRKQASNLRKKLLKGREEHIYRDSNENALSYFFSPQHFFSSQIFSPAQVSMNAKRSFINAAKTTILFLESKKMMSPLVRRLVARKKRHNAGI